MVPVGALGSNLSLMIERKPCLVAAGLRGPTSSPL
jgi:hypothetical protein